MSAESLGEILVSRSCSESVCSFGLPSSEAERVPLSSVRPMALFSPLPAFLLPYSYPTAFVFH